MRFCFRGDFVSGQGGERNGVSCGRSTVEYRLIDSQLFRHDFGYPEFSLFDVATISAVEFWVKYKLWFNTVIMKYKWRNYYLRGCFNFCSDVYLDNWDLIEWLSDFRSVETSIFAVRLLGVISQAQIQTVYRTRCTLRRISYPIAQIVDDFNDLLFQKLYDTLEKASCLTKVTPGNCTSRKNM